MRVLPEAGSDLGATANPLLSLLANTCVRELRHGSDLGATANPLHSLLANTCVPNPLHSLLANTCVRELRHGSDLGATANPLHSLLANTCVRELRHGSDLGAAATLQRAPTTTGNLGATADPAVSAGQLSWSRPEGHCQQQRQRQQEQQAQPAWGCQRPERINQQPHSTAGGAARVQQQVWVWGGGGGSVWMWVWCGCAAMILLLLGFFEQEAQEEKSTDNTQVLQHCPTYVPFLPVPAAATCQPAGRGPGWLSSGALPMVARLVSNMQQ
eukprot:1161407-Pelagomonas_calceolata.AAC.5